MSFDTVGRVCPPPFLKKENLGLTFFPEWEDALPDIWLDSRDNNKNWKENNFGEEEKS
jgi:hypothetical protein